MSYTLTTLRTSIQDYTENDETTFVSNFPLSLRLISPMIPPPISSNQITLLLFMLIF